MNPITTVEALVKELENAGDKEQAGILKRIQIPHENYEPYISWCSGSYTRNCIARTEQFEAILLCWDQYAETPIHGHDGQDCWVYQVKGTVEEKRYTRQKNGELSESARLFLREGRLSYMNDHMGYHLIRNTSGHRAMTLHIYSSPIDECEVYCDDSEVFNVVEMEYDTLRGEKIKSTVIVED